MTTGRINQVTTFQNHSRGHQLLAACQGHSPLSRCGVCQLLFASNIVDPPWLADDLPPYGRGYKRPQTHRWRHLVSRSHTSWARSPCPVERQRSPPLMRTTNDRQHLKGMHRHGGSPSG